MCIAKGRLFKYYECIHVYIHLCCHSAAKQPLEGNWIFSCTSFRWQYSLSFICEFKCRPKGTRVCCFYCMPVKRLTSRVKVYKYVYILCVFTPHTYSYVYFYLCLTLVYCNAVISLLALANFKSSDNKFAGQMFHVLRQLHRQHAITARNRKSCQASAW